MGYYRMYEGVFTGSRYKPGTEFFYHLSVPDAEEPFGLYISCDGQNAADEEALMQLAEENLAPHCVCIGVRSGRLKTESGIEKKMRADDYDPFSREYADFLLYELIPGLAAQYQFSISPSPDHHVIGGGSSGGICAFAAAWFHPEFFHRVYMSSPSFLAMGRGNEIPVLVRKYETKPIRVYEEYSEWEPDDYFGNSFLAAKEIALAMQFANYDFRCKYFAGEWHCSRYLDFEEARSRMRLLWKEGPDYRITAPGNSARVRDIIPDGSRWELCSTFPAPADVTREVYSSDSAMLYSGTPEDDVLYAAVIQQGKITEKRYVHGMLHTLPQVFPKGTIDLAIDEEDRLYVLTAIGIQCVRSFGLIDAILELPEAGVPERISFGKDDPDSLFIQMCGHVWHRKMRCRALTERPTVPRHVDYYD